MHIDPTREAFGALLAREQSGPVVMLNLLRFRAVADYAAAPELAPDEPISGAEAYHRYMAHTRPHVAAAGGEIVFMGDGGAHLVGPADERWDVVLLIRYPSMADFVAFASNKAYLAGIGHRTAALEDSRLTPFQPTA